MHHLPHRLDPKSEGHDHLAGKFVPGEWMESSVDFDAGPPTLGVRIASGRGERGDEMVDTFVPGMILTIDRNLLPGQPSDVIFRRLFAPLAAHTTQRQARRCESCHNDPVALGYGKGRLRFEPARAQTRAAASPGTGSRPNERAGRTGTWLFTPARPASPQDGLPEDAWTGFLAERAGMVSTREGARPFRVDEQRRILAVGACLGCHAGDSPPMKRALADFSGAVAARSSRCVVATFR